MYSKTTKEITQLNPVNGLPQYNPITIGEWIIKAIIFSIPIVGFMMLFIWGFGRNIYPSKSNWSKASLLWLELV